MFPSCFPCFFMRNCLWQTLVLGCLEALCLRSKFTAHLATNSEYLQDLSNHTALNMLKCLFSATQIKAVNSVPPTHHPLHTHTHCKMFTTSSPCLKAATTKQNSSYQSRTWKLYRVHSYTCFLSLSGDGSAVQMLLAAATENRKESKPYPGCQSWFLPAVKKTLKLFYWQNLPWSSIWRPNQQERTISDCAEEVPIYGTHAHALTNTHTHTNIRVKLNSDYTI